jgi:hypothetical protein
MNSILNKIVSDIDTEGYSITQNFFDDSARGAVGAE